MYENFLKALGSRQRESQEALPFATLHKEVRPFDLEEKIEENPPTVQFIID